MTGINEKSADAFKECIIDKPNGTIILQIKQQILVTKTETSTFQDKKVTVLPHYSDKLSQDIRTKQN